MSQRWMRDLPHDVYEISDSNGITLYVGVSMNTERRLLQHKTKPWFERAAAARVSTYANLEVAKHVEGRLIAQHAPDGNSIKERWAASKSLPAESLQPSSVRVVSL